MATASVRTVMDPFVRVRLVSFHNGSHTCSLQDLRLRIDTFDLQQTATSRPKFPTFTADRNCFYFETRTMENRKVTIGVFIPVKNTSYKAILPIETLIRDADEKIRDYRFSDKARASMSVELIMPKDLRETRRSEHEPLKKHYGHEFLLKYFTHLPGFCTICKNILWGLNKPGLRCQLCDLVVHESCMEQVVFCKQVSHVSSPTSPAIPHEFVREPNFLPVICDHDGKIIRPLIAWKCSKCKMVVHSKCREKVAHICGIRQEAVENYEKWKEQNQPTSVETYMLSDDYALKEDTQETQKIILNIFQGLKDEKQRPIALRDLHMITRPYEAIATTSQNSYYNRSAILLHRLIFNCQIGRGMSGSIYLVKDSSTEYALKALRKHRILESNEFGCIKNERDIMISCRNNPFLIQLYAVFHDFERVYFLLEFAPCGAFYDFLLRCGQNFDSNCIKWFSGQIVCALSYLHSKLIIHRDLKPENVLLMRDGRLKLADFGFAKVMKSRKDVAKTFCGTLEYIAPEIFQKVQYSFPVDCWALGVMIYEMRVLKTPFYHPSEKEIRAHVAHGAIHFPSEVSVDLQDLIINILKRDPNERYGIDDIRSHKFYSSPYSIDDIEQLSVKCPWKKAIPLIVLHDSYTTSNHTILSRIDEEALCATHTVDKAKFRGFSFGGI